MASDSSDPALLFRDVLYEALAGGEPAVRDAEPLLLLARLSERARPKANPAAQSELEVLQTVSSTDSLEAAISAAEEHFETPGRFREAIYFARCLDRDDTEALSLLQARSYLQTASLPAAGFTDLRTDRQAVLDAAIFATLWHDPGRLDWMREVAQIWRRSYTATYAAQHATFHAALAKVVEQIDASGQAALAMERLNSLRRLGPPLALAAIDQFHEMERLFACQIKAGLLLAALESAPVCPDCSYCLGEEAPAADARRIRAAIERGLATQQVRLSQRVISRLLNRPGSEDGLNRFIDVVQASDLAGLALVLDEGLLEFLRDLLATQDEPGLLNRLSRSFPEVTPANLDSAVAEFRRLLEEGLAVSNHLRLRGDDEA